MPRYKIFPPIGFARIGHDDDYFVGPEVPGQGPIEVTTGLPVTRFKNADKKRIRKQAARFRLFQSDDGVTWMPAVLPTGAIIEWSVTLENQKAAVDRPDQPPTSPTRPVIIAAMASMHIKAPKGSVSGADAVGASLTGPFTSGAFNAMVKLGALRTDGQQNLLVLGGDGISGAPPNTPIGASYYRNPNWFDDVADGPVTASIRLSPGADSIHAEGGAWVIIGPPDYAPGVGSVVTLYDVIRQVGIDSLGLPAPAGQPSFDLDIAPIIQRARRHRFVHDDGNWSRPALSDPNLRSKENAHAALRAHARDIILNVEDILEGHTSPAGPAYRLRKHQRDTLDAWVAGNFDDTPVSFGNTPTPNGLTRAALESAVGQGFCPGIEAGIIVLDPALYLRPFDFRIDQANVKAGDITALMAQPWQADFLKCNTEWWPSQRPDIAPQVANPDDLRDWVRGARGHQLLVERFERLGFIVQQGANEVFFEVERDPSLSETLA